MGSNLGPQEERRHSAFSHTYKKHEDVPENRFSHLDKERKVALENSIGDREDSGRVLVVNEGQIEIDNRRVRDGC